MRTSRKQPLLGGWCKI